MEAFVLRCRLAQPGAVLALLQRIFHSADVKQDALGFGRNHAGPDAPFRIDLWVLLTRLIQGGWLEILHHWLVCLCDGRKTGQKGESKNVGFHEVLVMFHSG